LKENLSFFNRVAFLHKNFSDLAGDSCFHWNADRVTVVGFAKTTKAFVAFHSDFGRCAARKTRRMS